MYANACLLSAGEPGCPDLATAQRRTIAAMNHATEFLAGHPTPEHCNGQSRIQQLEEQVEIREYARRDAERRAQAAEEDAKEYGDALKIAAQRLIKVEAELAHLKAQKEARIEELEAALKEISENNSIFGADAREIAKELLCLGKWKATD